MVGHVDHGKTSLTFAITGKWTDTHSEELKRGISIRLGYADATFYKCEQCEGSEAYTNKAVCPNCGKKATLLRRVSFVDAPGHETLMATMLSGAALMNGAILVIAANEQCPQPQTEEHLMAIKIAGIENLIVAQNKIDLVDKAQALENGKQIAMLLEKYGYKNVPIIPIAATFSTNLDMLIEAIERHIPTPHFDTQSPLLMYCARSFDVNKPGTTPEKIVGGIVGGSIVQGKVKVGDEIAISPGVDGREIKTRVKSLSCVGGQLQEARPGGLVAAGTGLDPTLTQNDRMRGQVITNPGSLPQSVDKLQLQVSYFERLLAGTEKKIATNDTVVLTVGTMSVVGVVTGMQGNKINISLKGKAVVLPKQKIAISTKDSGRWRLVAYAVA
ncbi:MAG: translation initiation factor IF-2 subunit gamma [Candidatus Diapherotrites archaeon]|nr:translation initiation factor IF-2 subunit gamma [Candidatus Diapherotrites archaeon]